MPIDDYQELPEPTEEEEAEARSRTAAVDQQRLVRRSAKWDAWGRGEAAHSREAAPQANASHGVGVQRL